MDNNFSAKKYRISDFAHYMGVTPDFLKHYEASHVLAPSREDNGYRFYSFTQAPLVFESLRLRSYGITVRQMEEFLKDLDSGRALATMDAQAEMIEKRIVRDTALLEDHRDLKQWIERRHGKPYDWEITESEGFYFLPHSDQLSFLDDERIYAILPDWIAWIPIVKSTVRFCRQTQTENEAVHNLCWGLSVSQRDAQRLAIPINSVVQYVPPVKTFLFHFTDITSSELYAFRLNCAHPLYKAMDSLGVCARGDSYMKVRLAAQLARENERTYMGTFAIPIGD